MSAKESRIDDSRRRPAEPSIDAGLPGATGEATPKRPGRWRRRLKWALFIVIALVILLRISLGFALPYVVNGVASAFGMSAHYDHLSLSLTGGEARVWNLRVVPKDPSISGGEPVFTANYLRGDISPLALLQGRIVVWRAEADTLELRLERRADGSIPLLDAVPASSPAAEPVQPSEQRPLSFTAPLAVDALRLNRVRAHIKDEAVEPPLETTIDLNVYVSKVGPDAPQTEVEIDIFAPGLLDVLKVRAVATAHERELDSRFDVELFGLRPGMLAGYLENFGLRPAADEVSARMTGTLITSPVLGDDRAIDTVLTLNEIACTDDGTPDLKVRQVRIAAPYVGPAGVDATELLVEGVRFAARRNEDGTTHMLGVELGHKRIQRELREGRLELRDTFRQSPPPQEGLVGQAATLPAPMSFKLAQLNLRDLTVAFSDHGVVPPAQLSAGLPEFSVRDLAWPPLSDDAAVTFEASLAAPGIGRNAHISGELKPYGQEIQLTATMAGEGLVTTAIEPYLRLAGIESVLQEGYFSADVQASLDAAEDGSPRLSAQLRDVRFTDGAGEGSKALVLMPEVSLDGFALLADGTLRVDELTLRGPSLDVILEPDGAITAAGFRMLPATPQPLEPAPDDAPTRPAEVVPAAPTIRAIDLGHVNWEGFAFRLTEAAADPPLTTTIADAVLDVRDLRIDIAPPSEGANDSRAGSIAVRFAAPELISRFEATGTLEASAGTLEANLDFAGEGLTLATLRPLLARRGIDVQWNDAKLAGAVTARSTAEEGALLPRLDLELRHLALSDGQSELAGLDSLAVKEFVLQADGAIHLQTLETARPRIRGSRGTDGSITLAGVRFASAAVGAPAADEASQALPAAQLQDGDAAPAQFPFAPLVLPPIAIGQVKVSEAGVTFKDEMRPDSPEIVLTADVELGRLDTINPAAAQTPFSMTLGGPGVESMRAIGTIMLRPEGQRVVAELSAENIDGAQLAALMPPGIELAVTDGMLRLTVDSELRPGIAEGGLAARLALNDLEWRNGDQPLATLESLDIDVSRFDLSNGEIEVARARVAGIASAAKLGTDGAVTVAGIRIGSAIHPVGEAAPQPQPAAVVEDAAMQEIPVARQDVAADAQEVRAALAEAAQAALPRVSIRELDLQLLRFAVTDESRPLAAPLVLEDVRLTNPQPILLDPEADESTPPTALALRGAIQPVIGEFSADIRTQPMARAPTLSVSLRAQGINGQGLLQVAPELAQQIDATGLTDGRFTLDLEGRFDVQRRGGIPDLASGIGGELLVRDIAFRSGENGPVLLGLDELEADRIRFEPQTGGLAIGTLELRTPRAQVALDERGLHAAGLVFLRQPSEQAPEAPADEPSAELAAAGAQQPPETATTTAALPPELRIESLRISGLDFVYEDRTVDPPLVAPINSLDVDVRGLSSRLAHEPRTMRFSVLANAGQIELPKPPEQSGIIGAVGDVGRMLGGDKEDEGPVQMEKRDLFAQFSTNGRLQLYPAPDGRGNLSLTGLELLCLRGLAETQNVIIGNGVLDVNADLKLNSDSTIDVRSKSAFTTLRVSEPADGPIYRYLRLPAPLDTVIVTLQDAGGTITLPVSVTVEHGQIGSGELVPAVAGALSQVIATAVVQSPFKVAGGAMALIGISSGQRGTAHHEFELSFEPGSTQLARPSLHRLAQARKILAANAQAKASIRHRLGAQDVPLIARWANPAPDEALAVAARLRGERNQLLDDRAQLVGHARSAIAFGTPGEAAAAAESLRKADARAAQLDQSIDAALEMLSPGAARRADRRTRTTAISLGEQRLERIESLLGAGARAQKANAQFDPPNGAEAEQADRSGGGIIEIEIVYPRRGRDFIPYVPFL